MYSNTTQTYGLVSILLHWLSAIAVFALFGLGFWMVDLNYYSEWYRTAPHWHKSFGLLLFALTIFRVIWKVITPSPKAIVNTRVESIFVHSAHGMLYLLLIIIFFSGYLISTADGRGIEVFNWFTIPSIGEIFSQQEDVSGEIHKYSAYVIIGLALLHALAALKHHFISRDNTLKRMLTPFKN